HISTQEKQQKQLNTALGRLAKRAMNSEDSWFLLRYQLVREELGDETEKGSLFWWALQLGLLKPIVLEAKSSAEKIYAFFHPTFQEYFAALAVDDWHEFLTRVSEDPRQGIYRVFEPQWREVILLWLGREDVERLQKEALIQALIEFDDGCEIFKNKDVHKGFYEYQAYFLAAAGIAEFQESERAEEIASEFARYSCQTEWWIRDRASVTLLQTNYDLVGRILTDLLATTEDAYTRRNIAESLGKIDPGNREAIAALAHLVAITEDENTCFCAAENLAKIDPLNPKVIPVLFKLASPKVSDSTFFLYLDFSLILLEKPLLTGQMPFVVSEWKSYLTEHFYEADKFVYGQLFDTIWNCAQTLSYLEFYRAWHHLDNN
ncbi:MAG: HEAT repeat domain-containing protein, partial [Cyanobacteriota bacterium]|nr:HEAT repeat domain-containing protein [Cyanobacteriota bacterium]